MAVTYESILEQVMSLSQAPEGGARDILWLTSSRVVAAARDKSGRLEIFLAGAPLSPRTVTVQRALQYHDWYRVEGAPLSANRLLLPALGHFDQVGAFICTELLRNGADHDLSSAFDLTEPIIELAIKRLAVSESSLTGLVGELLILSSLLQQAGDEQVGAVLQSWHGWHRSKRDFVWNRTGVEVKTTRRGVSRHDVQGVHQVEAIPEDDEDRLILVSIGLVDAEVSSSSFSIPTLVERILARLDESGNAGLKSPFLRNVAAYGSESGVGYEHETQSADAPFTSTYAAVFCRGYHMEDRGIEVLRHDTVARHHHVDLQSVAFTVSLPATISSQNPVSGANQVAREILR